MYITLQFLPEALQPRSRNCKSGCAKLPHWPNQLQLQISALGRFQAAYNTNLGLGFPLSFSFTHSKTLTLKPGSRVQLPHSARRRPSSLSGILQLLVSALWLGLRCVQSIMYSGGWALRFWAAVGLWSMDLLPKVPGKPPTSRHLQFWHQG